MKKTILILLFIFSLLLFADIPEGYYNGTDGVNGEELKSVLHNIIDNHVEFSYNDLRDFILKDTDEDENNSNNVIMIYTGWSKPKNDFGGGASEWNREHVWAKSHGGFGNNPPCGTDAHHIRPADVTVNSRRGNLDFDNGGSEYIDGDGATGCNVDSNSWEPRDEVKGDVARMIFYMTVRYEGTGGEPDLEMVDNTNSSPNGEPFLGKKSILLAWHHSDPVSDWEIRRNDRVYSYQQNRNPFIDHPDFVGRIWEGVAVNEDILSSHITLEIFPNPFNPNTNISFFSENQSEKSSLVIYNVKGEHVRDFRIDKGLTSVIWDGKDNYSKPVSTGIYFTIYQNGDKTISKKMILLK